MQSYKLLKNSTIYLYWWCGLEINILFKYQTSFIPFSSKRLSKLFQRKRYYFSVARDKKLVNLVWHLILLNGNSLQENGIIILDFIFDSAIRQRYSLTGFFFSLVQVSLYENGIFRERSRSLLCWECRWFRNCFACLFHFLCVIRLCLTSLLAEKFIKALFLRIKGSHYAGDTETKLISLSTLARELGFHFVWDPSWEWWREFHFSFSIFVSRVVLVNSITHEGNWTEKKQISWDCTHH